MQVEVIEQDGEKFVIIPDDVLGVCNIKDVLDISVENNYILLKPVISQKKGLPRE